MKKSIKTSGIVKSFMSLSFANIISTIAVMVQGMILVRALSKIDYGTYAQTNVILTITNTVIGLGLAASINFFIPKSDNNETKRKYVNNIFNLIIFSGLIGFIGILTLQELITDFFNNSLLKPLLIIVAFRPLFFGVLQAFINLFIANKHADVVAIRNLIMSLLSVIILSSVSMFTHNIKYIIICLLVFDALQCVYFYFYSKSKWGPISLFRFDIPTIKEIFSYSIPLALSSIVGTLNIQLDRLVIGNLFTTDKFAEYSVVSTPLPFIIFSTAIITVIRPYITKSYNLSDISSVKKIWSSSIEFSAIITWTLGFAIMLVSSEVLTFLYTDEYIGGLLVFNIYIIYSMIGITYYGMLLSASGNSKYIFIYAIAALLLNLILNFVFYGLFGYIGPALASICSQLLINSLQIIHSSKILNCKIKDIFVIKPLVFYLLIMIIVYFLISNLKLIFYDFININEIAGILLFGGVYCVMITVIFYKRMKTLSFYLKTND